MTVKAHTGKNLSYESEFGYSKQFTQLDTLTTENRIAEYNQPDVATQPNPLNAYAEQELLHIQASQSFKPLLKDSFMQMKVLKEEKFPPKTN